MHEAPAWYEADSGVYNGTFGRPCPVRLIATLLRARVLGAGASDRSPQGIGQGVLAIMSGRSARYQVAGKPYH
jgi:hypothetical protein